MKLVLLSDTHGLHRRLGTLPTGDVLIHAGDITNRGEEHTVRDFLNWFTKQPHKHKIFIAGNHDFFFEDVTSSTLRKLIPSNIHYLNDSGVVLDDVHFWGTPVTPYFFNWAFNRQRGKDIAAHYLKFPERVDVLISHGPPKGILDAVGRMNEAVGCEELLKKVAEVKPRVHVFGHIHEHGGKNIELDGTQYINASVLERTL